MTDDPAPQTVRDYTAPWRVHPDPADGEWIGKLGYENYVMRRRALQWLAVSLPNVSQVCRDQQAALMIGAYWQDHPTFADICRVRNARAEWERHQAWAEGTGERGGFTRTELLNLQDRYSGANDPVSQAIEAKVAALLAWEE